MNTETVERVRLADPVDEAGRTTASLISSLATRLGSLHLISGATALGSLIAGFAALGREVSCTARGARMRSALESGRAATNAETLWLVLGIDQLANAPPPSPVLNHLRNDLAMLLAEDLEETLETFQTPPATGRGVDAEEGVHVTPVDVMLGMWIYSLEVVRIVEALSDLRPPSHGEVEVTDAGIEDLSGQLLR